MMVFLLLAIFLIIISISWTCVPSPRDQSWPIDYETPFPYPTPSPIALVTNQSTISPLAVPIATFNGLKPYTVINTGSSILVIPNDQYARIRGGFFKTPFVLESSEFTWGPNVNSSIGYTIDGVGGPVQASLYYRNTKYSSPKEALEKRDGYVRIFGVIRIVETPNLLFELFRPTLEGPLKRAPSKVDQISSEIFLWLTMSSTPVFLSSYFFPGSYKGKDCTIDITFNNLFQPTLSLYQFKAFTGLRTAAGRPAVSKPQKPVPSGCRPISTGQILLGIPLPI